MFVGKFCLISNEKILIFLGTNSSIIIVSISDEFFTRDTIAWPAVQHQSNVNFKKGHCDSVIYSVIQLKPDLYEICGKFDINVRCSILMKKGLVWSSLLEEHVFLGYPNSRIIYEYSDGYLTLAYLSNRYIPRLELKQLNLISNRIVNVNETLQDDTLHHLTDDSNIYDNDYWSLHGNSIRWNKLLETSKLKNSHFTEGYEFMFYKILSLPGKRYVVFQEPAIETQLRENPWTSERKIVYTRIARICTEDKGFLMPNDGSKLFTSFFKTRLVCQVRTKTKNLDESSSSISSTNRDFNYLVALSTSYIPQIKNDLLIYGLFSARDPQLNNDISLKLTNNLVTSGPLALCIYKLSTVDKIIESSDLMLRLPTFTPFYYNEQMMNRINENYSKFNDESHLFLHCRHRYTNGFKRISRNKYPYLKNLTKCPGLTATNKRLSLEASLLIDSVYPERFNIFGMIETRSQITGFIIDPRHVAKIYQDKTQPGQIKHIRYTIFYIGTNNGDVFKMLLFNEIEDNSPEYFQFTSNSYGNHSTSTRRLLSHFNIHQSILSISTSGNIHIISQLLISKNHNNNKITNLLLLHKSYLNRTIQIRSSNEEFNYSTMDIFSLLIFTDDTMIQIQLSQCDKVKTCRECLALRDPDCYWNKLLQKCDTNSEGLSNILTGFHKDCGESNDVESEILKNSDIPVDLPAKGNFSTGLLFPFQNIWNLLFPGFVGIIIGLIIGIILFIIRKKYLKLSHSRRLSMTNHQTSINGSFKQIHNFTHNHQYNYPIHQSKQLHEISTSHLKFVTNSNIPMIDNRDLLLSPLNNLSIPYESQTIVEVMNTNKNNNNFI
uniref:Sema domain-containing protein n=1 Tax=Schistosoma mansoni TaxID=6183 RepID=A0A5K4FDH5_SCHMA